MRFTFAVEGEVQIDRTLTRFIDDLEDARPVWEVLAGRFAKMEARQFASEGAYGSGRWAALSPDYALWKAANYGTPILERTGALKASLTARPFGVEEIDARAMAVGSGIDYGKYHQAGTARMPQRRPVEFPESERRVWVRIIQRFIMTGEARY